MVKTRNAATLFALALMLTTCLGAQERRSGGPPPYDVASEVTVTGTVMGVETVEVGPGVKRVILKITVDNAPLGVILGPDGWVEKQGVTFAKGVTAQVVGLTGFRYEGGSAMMPRMVKVGSKTLTLRDATGKPLWDQ
jgi:hypothetical protein